MIIQQLSTSAESFEQQFAQLLHWDMHTDSELDQRVAAILGQVRQRGDDAVLELTNELDRRNLTAPADFVLSAETLQAAWHKVQLQHQDALQPRQSAFVFSTSGNWSRLGLFMMIWAIG